MTGKAPAPELILHLAAEGGGVRLIGVERSGTWKFRLVTSDWTLALLDEPWEPHESAEIDGWSLALELLDRYPWVHLSPCIVHERFKAQILAAARERLSSDGLATSGNMRRWEAICKAS